MSLTERLRLLVEADTKGAVSSIADRDYDLDHFFRCVDELRRVLPPGTSIEPSDVAELLDADGEFAAAVAALATRLVELDLRPGDLERDERRPLADYPTMPAGTCFISSRVLAELYPELDVVYGHIGGVAHAWNVRRGDGQLVDSTLGHVIPPHVAERVYATE